MVTTRDLVEAEAWERRRVVRAFVSGHPRRGAPRGPSVGRCLVAGAALSVFLVLGAAAARVLGLS